MTYPRPLFLLALLALLSGCQRGTSPPLESGVVAASSPPSHTLVRQWGSLGSGSGAFRYPNGVAVSTNGTVFVADTNNHRVQAFSSEGGFLASWGGRGSAAGQFNFPRGVAVDQAGQIFVADTANHRVQVFSADGTLVRSWGGSGTGAGQFSGPYGVAVDAAGHVFIADTGNHRVQKFHADGTFVAAWGSLGTVGGRFQHPIGLAVSGEHLFVSDLDNHRIQRFSLDGTFQTAWNSYGEGAGRLKRPFGVAVDGGGRVYVADQDNQRIGVFDPHGAPLGGWDVENTDHERLNYPLGVAVDPGGNVYVTDLYNHLIQVFAPPAEVRTTVLLRTSGEGTFGRTATLRATLRVDGGARRGAAVTFALSGTPVGTATTGDDGVAVLTGVSLTGLGADAYPQAVSAQVAEFGRSARGVLTVRKAPQTLQFTSPAPSGVLVGGRHNVTAEASTGLRVEVTSDTPEVCTLTANGAAFSAAFVAPGTCTLRAAQPGNANVHAAPEVTREITVAAINVTSRLTGVAGTGVYGGAATLSAQLTAEGAVEGASALEGKTLHFKLQGRDVGTATTDTQGRATLSGVALTRTGAGTYAEGVAVHFAGEAGLLGSSGSGALVVDKAPQTLRFTTAPLSPTRVGDRYRVEVASSAGLPVQLASGTLDTCTLAGELVTFTAPGTCRLQATGTGNANYHAPATATQQVTVDAAPTVYDSYTVTFDRLALKSVVSQVSLNRGVVSSSGTQGGRIGVFARRKDRSGNVAVLTGTQRQLLISRDGRSGTAYAKGGYLEFDFSGFGAGSVTVRSLMLYGVTTSGGTVEAVGADGRTKRLNIPRTTASGRTTLMVAGENVRRLRVNLTGPGRVDNLVLEAAR